MTSSNAGMSRRRFCAELRCGSRLFYEWAHLVPAAGELVPCHAHGYCAVTLNVNVPRTVRPRARAKRRTSDELLEYIGRHDIVRLAELRRRRFSLRLVAIAEKAGALEVDWELGVVRTLQSFAHA